MSAPSGDRFPLFPLLVLAGAIFVSVSSEFLPTGLLPDISADLGVSESRVGLLVAVFAFTVVVTAAPLTVLTRRFSRKGLLVALLGIFALSNLLAAAAPNYETLAAARVLGGFAHGLFWAVVGPYVSLLVAPRQLARAISVTTGGGALAFMLGVPFTAALGHVVGWRWAFVAMAVLVVVEGSLSFLGYGIPAPNPSWGGMIAAGADVIRRFPVVIVAPVVTLFLTVFSFNAIGDYLGSRTDRREAQL